MERIANIKSLIKAVRDNNRFLIVSHINPEGDSIGCQLAFKNLLTSLGKDARIVNNDKVPDNYKFIPGCEHILRKLDDFKYDVLIALDCSDLSRIGDIRHKLDKNALIINIDHHISNKYFGHINWVDSKFSSTCEMVYKLYKKLSVSINKETALALYAGLVSDTGSFRYPNTTKNTFSVAAKLLEHKLSVYDIYYLIFGGFSFHDLRLVARLLLSLHYDEAKKVSWLKLDKTILKGKNINSDVADLMLSLMRLLKGIEVIVLLKETANRQNEIRVNFRSSGKVDVNKIASLFGGGGHPTASSCVIKENIQEAEERILKALGIKPEQ